MLAAPNAPVFPPPMMTEGSAFPIVCSYSAEWYWGRSKVREKLVGALADVRQGADVGGSVDRSARLRPRREVRRLHAGRRLVSPVSTEWSILDCLFKLFRRGVGTPPLEDGRFSVENKGGYGESFAFEVPVYRPVNSSAFWHVPNNHRIASR